MKKLDLFVNEEVITTKDGKNLKVKKMYVDFHGLHIPLVLKNIYGELDNQLFDKLLEETNDEE